MQYSCDLEAYADQIRTIPRVTPEEEAQLLAQIRQAHDGHLPAEQGIQAKHRLVEGYLGLVVFLVRQHRQTLKHLSPLDLVQEGNLALVQVVDAAHTFTQGTFCGYIAGAIRHALSKARTRDDAIYLASSSAYYLRKAGQIQEVNKMQPCSLDAPLRCDRHRVKGDQRSWEDVLVTLSLSSREPPAQVIQQVETLLPCLTERQRQIIAMRYGLGTSPCYSSQREVASVLGITAATVADTEELAMRRLRRTLMEGIHPVMILPSSQERLEATYKQLYLQGTPITARLLVKTAHVHASAASRFLTEREGPPEERLTRAYALLVVEGKTPNTLILCRMAHVTIKAASAFVRTHPPITPPNPVVYDKPVSPKALVVHEKREVRYARLHQEQQARLEAAYEQLRAQGILVTATRLSQETGTDRSAAQAFCRTHGPGEQERLAQALSTLQAHAEPVTVAALCHQAGVSGKQASAFLRAIRGTEQERLAAALAELQTQSERIGIRRLAHAAQVITLTASAFVREHAETQKTTMVLVG